MRPWAAIWLATLIHVSVLSPAEATEPVDCSATVRVEPGPSPSLSLIDIDYGTFDYPRTLPIKASLTDIDQLEVACPNCANGNLVKGLADDAHPTVDDRSGYRWTLKGPGSLNQAYDMRSAEAARRALDETLNTRDDIRAEIADLDAAIARDDETLEALEETFRTHAERRTKLTEELDDLSAKIGHMERAIAVSEVWSLGPTSARDQLRLRHGKREVEASSLRDDAPEVTEPTHAELVATRRGLDEQIARLEYRLFELGAYSPRFAHTSRLPMLNDQLDAAARARQARHEVTCDLATKAVPLLLSLGQTPSVVAARDDTLSSIRDFLEICDPERPPSFEAHRDGVLRLKETCQTLAFGIPSPSPVELEIAKTCGALYHELLAIDVEREVRARSDRQRRRPMLEDPRREMRALRVRLTELRNQSIDTNVQLLQTQHDEEMARLDHRRRPAAQQEATQQANAARDLMEGMATEAALRVQLLRDSRAASMDARESKRRALFRLERLTRQSQQAVRSHYVDSQRVRMEKAAKERALSLVESQLSTQRDTHNAALTKLTSSDTATGQIVWYSPPPLDVLIKADDEASRRLEISREAMRRAEHQVEKTKGELATLWTDQLERLEGIVNHVGHVRLLKATEDSLGNKKAQILEAIARRSDTLSGAAELRRTRLKELREELAALEIDSTLAEMDKSRRELEQLQRDSISEVESRTQAVSKPFELYVSRLRALHTERRRLNDTFAELNSTLATFMHHRTQATEHEASGTTDQEIKAIYQALNIDKTELLKSPSDAGHLTALLKRIEDHAAGVRREEQEGEETAALIGRHGQMLSATQSRIQQATTELEGARLQYRAAMAARVEAIATLDDVDARLRLVKMSIRARWRHAQDLAHALYSVLRDAYTATEGPVAYALQANVRHTLSAIPERTERFLTDVMGSLTPYDAKGTLMVPDIIGLLNPLVESARDALADLSSRAMSRPQALIHLAATHEQLLHHTLEQLEIELATTRRGLTAVTKQLNDALTEARQHRSMATDGTLNRVMTEAANARAAHRRQKGEIRARLVSRLTATLSLLATDQGDASGRADDEAVDGTARIQFNAELQASVSMPTISSDATLAARDTRGACVASARGSAGRPAKWSNLQRLPASISAGESISVAAMLIDEDQVQGLCEGAQVPCKPGAKRQRLKVTSYHPVTWSSADLEGFDGGAGRFAGGATTPGAVFVAPSADALNAGQTPVCSKPVTITASTASSADDLAPDRDAAPLTQTVIVKAGKLEPKQALLEGVAGQPITLTFDVSTRREDGHPLPSNVGFDEPLDGQSVTLKVTRLDQGASTSESGDWGFDGAQREITAKSRGGVIRETLSLAPTPGRYRVDARWRQGPACEASVEIVTPAQVAARVLYAPENDAFYDLVMPLVLKGSASPADLKALLSQLDQVMGPALGTPSQIAEVTDDAPERATTEALSVAPSGAWFKSQLQVWTITSNAQSQATSDVALTLSAKGNATFITPQADAVPTRGRTTTRQTAGPMGFARAHLIAKPSSEVTVSATATLDTVATRSVEASFGSAGQTMAKIGSHEGDGGRRDLFTLALNGQAEPGRIFHGEADLSGALFAGAPGQQLASLKGAAVNGLILDDEGLVTAGDVHFERRYEAQPTPSSCVELGGATLCIESLTLRAGQDANLSGKLILPFSGRAQDKQVLGPFDVWGTWRPGDGMWLEFIDPLPEVKLSAQGEAALEVGATALLDLSHDSSPPGLTKSWMGLYIHRPRVAVSPLRGVDQGRQRVVAPMDRLGWSWPLSTMTTFGHIAHDLSLGTMPGLPGASIERIHGRVQRGELVLDRTELSLPLPGGEGLLNAQLDHAYGQWTLGLGPSPAIRFGDITRLRLLPGASGVISGAGIERLIGTVELDIEGLSPLIVDGFEHPMDRNDLRVEVKTPPQSAHIEDRYPLTVHTVALTHRTDPVESPLGRTNVEVGVHAAMPSGSPASGQLNLTSDHRGVDKEFILDADLYVAGMNLSGALAQTHNGLEGQLKSGGSGMARIADIPYTAHVSAQEDPSTGARYLALSAYGAIDSGEDDAQRPRILTAPLWIDDGLLWLGFNHNETDGHVRAGPELRLAAPEQAGGQLALRGQKSGGLIRGDVSLRYTHGLPTVARLAGRFDLFGAVGETTGRGALRVGRDGSTHGEIALRLGLDGAVGHILSTTTGATVHASKNSLTIATERFEGLAAYASTHVSGRMKAEVTETGSHAKVTMPLSLWSRGTLSPVQSGEQALGLDFTADVTHEWTVSDDGKWALSAEQMRWRGYLSGAFNLGFLVPSLGSFFTGGDGVACYTPMCFSPRLDDVIDHLGLSLSVGPELTASGRCIRACAP